MVKVKDWTNSTTETKKLCFNHPMVKVKAGERCRLIRRADGFNHPMVKVKETYTSMERLHTVVSTTLWWKLKYTMILIKEHIVRGFNHPMVKVKDEWLCWISNYRSSFNHPMVKVKDSSVIPRCPCQRVSTTLWWKLKKWASIEASVNVSFNHPMVKVKETTSYYTNIRQMFQPPYGES